MNRIHRVVRSEETGLFMAVPETARSRGKSGTRSLCRQAAVATLSMSMATGGWALGPTALPSGAKVAAGTATVTQAPASAGSVLTVDQTSDRAVINWQAFDVGSASTVQFRQPSQAAVTLNRVIGADASQIMGRITAPGQVFLLNPNGILFGKTSSVNVGGLVATTHQLSDADFMAGRNTFSRQGATGAVINEGTLQTAVAGYAALLAPEVRNEGFIVARQGTVALASGEAITLQFEGTKMVGLTVTPSTIQSLVANRQAVMAPGGLIILAASAAGHLASGVVQNSGKLDASSLTTVGGRILLQASDQIDMSGQASAEVSSAQASGGAVTLDAREIRLRDESLIDASGATGGGAIHVGGAWQGQGPQRPALKVDLSSDTVLKADATQRGNGGEIVVFSDLHDPEGVTRAAGTLQARGGDEGGDGGRIETSGRHIELAGIRVDALARRGRAGDWLIDPYDVTISTGSDFGTTGYAADVSGARINTTTLQGALAGANVTVSTGASGAEAGNITVANALSWSANTTLTLDAAGGIVLNAGITHSGASSGLVLNAAGTGGISGAGALASSGNLTLGQNHAAASTTYAGVISGGGSVTKDGAGTLALSGTNSYTGSTTISAGTLQIGAGSTTGTLGTGIVTNNATLAFSRSNAMTVANAISGTGTILKSGSGTLTLSGTNSYTGGTTINGGNLTWSSDGNLGTGGLTYNVSSTAPWVDTAKAITLNNGAILAYPGIGVLNLSGAITGSGGLSFTRNNANSLQITLSNTGNTFTGPVTLSGGDVNLTVNSLADAAGAGNITFSGNTQSFRWGSGAVAPLSLNNRRLVLNSFSGPLNIENLNTNASNTLTINTDLLHSGTGGATSLTLGGANTGSNVFNGIISDGSGAIISVAKAGAGKWMVGGVNTYTGSTTLSAGTLGLLNTSAIGSSSSLSLASGTTLQLRSDVDATFTTPGNGSTTYAALPSGTATIDLGSVSGGASGKTLTLSGGVGITQVTSTLNLTSSDGYTLNAPVTLTQTSGTPSLTLNPTTANMRVSGLRHSFVTGGNGTLVLGGTSTGNQVNAGPDNAWMGLTKQGAGTWAWNPVVTGANALADVAVSAGNLVVNGTIRTTNRTIAMSGGTLHYNSPGAIDTTGSAWVITGGSLDNTSGAAITTSTTNPVITLGGNVSFTGSNGSASSLYLGTGAVTLTGNRQITVTHASSTLSLGGVISGAFSLSKLGAGTLALLGNNSYSGTTTISAGTLQLGNGGTTGSVGTGAVVDNAALVFNRSDAVTVSNAISGPGTLTQAGSGTLTLAGTNTYTGATSVDSGTLTAGSISAFGSNSATTVNGTLDLAGFNVSVGSLAGTGTVTNSGVTAATLTAGGKNTSTSFSGTLQDGAGALALTKAGSGTLTLAGENTYSGATTVSAGTLQVGAGGTSGSLGTGAVTTAGNLSFNRADDLVVSKAISGSGTLTQAGGGTLTLTGNNTYSGGTTVSAGTLLGATATALSTGPMTVATGATLDLGGINRTFKTLNGAGTVTSGGAAAALGIGIPGIGGAGGTFSGTLQDGSGPLGLTLTGANLTLSGTHTFTGNLNLDYYSTLTVSGSGSLGGGAYSGAIRLSNGVLKFSSSADQTLSGAITSTGGNYESNSIIKDTSAASTLTIASAWNYSVPPNGAGNITVNAGVLKAGSASAFGGTQSTVTVGSGATLDLSGFSNSIGSLAGAGTVTSSAASAATLTTGALNTSTTFSGVVQDGAGVVGLTKTGTGVQTLSGSNTYTGATTVSAGTLKAGSASALGVSSAATVNGTLDLNGQLLSIGSLAGAGTVTNSSATAAMLTAGSNNTSTSFSGIVQNGTGTVSLDKAGSGALALTGANTYTGATTVSAGTLKAGSASALGVSSAATVNGTLDLNGQSLNIGSLAGAGTVTNSSATPAMLSAGSNNSSTSFSGIVQDGTGTVALDKTGSGSLTLTGANTYTGGTTIVAGTLVAGSSSALGAPSATTVNGTLDLNGQSLDIGSLAGAGTVTNSSATSATLTAGSDNTSTSFYGTVQDGTGTVALNKAGSGVLILAGANSYSGATTINAGVLQVGDGGSTGTLGSGAVTDHAALVFNRSNAVTVANAISGTGSLSKSGGGTLMLTGANTYTGQTTIYAGTLKAGSASALSTHSAATVAGTLDLAGFSNSLGSLAGAGTITNSSATAATLTVGANNASSVFSGVMQDGAGLLALSKTGTGALSLSGTSTFSGSLGVEAGTLSLDGAWSPAAGTSSTAVAPGATLSGAGVLTATTLQHSGQGTLSLTGNNLIDRVTTLGTVGTLHVNNAKSLEVDAIESMSSIQLMASGADADLRLLPTAVLSSFGTGSAVILAAGRDFINDAGANAIVAPNGRWLIYAANPGSSLFGGLQSDGTALWAETASLNSQSPAAAAAAGNRYLFASSSTLTVTSTDLTKSYGDDVSGAVATAYTVTGYHPGVAGAFDGDTAASAFSGVPALTSAGSSPTASVAGGPYAIGVAPGSFLAQNGYNVSFNAAGTVTVQPAALSLGGSKVYDGTTAIAGANLMATGVLGETFSVTGSGATGNLASRHVQTAQPLVSVAGLALGTSGNGGLAGNYLPLDVAGSSVSVTPAPLTVSTASVTKTYDGTTSAAGTPVVVAGTLASVDALQGGSFAFTDKNAGSGKTVSVGGVTVADGNGGANYSLGLVDNTSSTINPAALSLGGSKVYDGTTAIAGANLMATGVLGETFSVTGSGAIGNLASRHVQTAQPLVSVAGLALGTSGNGGLAGNYLPLDVAGSSVSVTPAPLTVSTASVTKTYDGTTSAAGTPVVVAGTLASVDALQGGSFAFTDKNAGSGKTVSVGGVTVADGNGGANYSLGLVDNTSSTINPAALSLGGSKVYDGTTAIAGANLMATGVLGETFSVTGSGATGNLASRHVQTAQPLVSVAGLALGTSGNGGLAGNYLPLDVAGSSVSVTPAPLTVSTASVTKTYDGTTSAAGTPVVVAGTLASVDALQGGSFAFTDKNAGSGKTVSVGGVTVADGNGGANYSLGLVDNTSSTINPAALSLGGSKVYDGTTAIAGANLMATGVLGETFSVTGSGATGNLASRHVQTAQPLVSVAGLALGTSGNGGLAGNYLPLDVAGSSVSVTPAPLTVSTASVTKTYDGTTSAAGTPVVVAGTLAREDALYGGSFSFVDPTAGFGKTVNVVGVGVRDGNHGANYRLSLQPNISSQILPRVLWTAPEVGAALTPWGFWAPSLTQASPKGCLIASGRSTSASGEKVCGNW